LVQVLNVSPLVIENSTIKPSGGYGTFGGAIVKVADCRQQLIIRNCLFESPGFGAVTVNVLDITSSSHLVFEDCLIIQQGRGKTLSVDSSSHDITFRRCRFLTSPTYIEADDIVANADGVGRNGIKFEDCYIELRSGDAAPTYRIELGSLGGTATGTNIEIDGLIVKLNYAGGYVNSNMFTLMTGNDYASTVSAYDLTLDLQSKQLGISNARVAYLEGFNGAALRVVGLYLKNITEPDGNAPVTSDTCSLITLGRGRIIGGSVTGTPTGTNPAAWQGIIHMTGSADSVEDFVFWENTSPNRGRLVYAATDRCKVLNNSVYVGALASTDSTEGWFCYTTANQCTISGNTLNLYGTMGLMSANTDGDSLIALGATSNQCVVANNVIRTTTHVRHLEVITPSGTHKGTHSITGNTFRTTYAGTAQVVRIGSGSTGNVILGNTGHNENASNGASISDAGTGTVGGTSNYMEP
jgi:hypothetical protein